MQTNLNVMVNGNNLGLQAMAYKYDQLNRIKETQAWAYEKNAQTNVMAWTAQGKRYKEGFSYDGNGNINNLKRYNQAEINPIDNLTYGYNIAQNNRLNSINDNTGNAEGLKSGSFAFAYDDIGNLTSDAEGEIESIKWTVYGKVEEVTKTAPVGQAKKIIRYRYDGTGNRSVKMFYEANVLKKTTYYFRDASGNVMGIYEQTENQTTQTLIEQPIYGSSRIGTYNGKSTQFKMTLGNKQYELSNHLQNTLVTISDNKIGVEDPNVTPDNTADFYEARVLSATDYYAFGMAMKERTWQSEKYRYGFNGKENDTDWEVQDYGFRIYKPELGKFLSVDPLSASYPWNSVYAFAENDVIRSIDLDGLERLIVINSRRVTKAFLRVKEQFGIKAAIKWAEAWANKKWPDDKDYYWLVDDRAQEIENNPFHRTAGYQIPNKVAETAKSNEIDKGTIVWGHFDKRNTENETYYQEIGRDVTPPTPPKPTGGSTWAIGAFVNPSGGASLHWGFFHFSVAGAFEGTAFTGQENGGAAHGLYMEAWGEAQFRSSFEEDGFDWTKFKFVPKATWDYGLKQGVLLDLQGSIYKKGTGWLGGSYGEGEIETTTTIQILNKGYQYNHGEKQHKFFIFYPPSFGYAPLENTRKHGYGVMIRGVKVNQ